MSGRSPMLRGMSAFSDGDLKEAEPGSAGWLIFFLFFRRFFLFLRGLSSGGSGYCLIPV